MSEVRQTSTGSNSFRASSSSRVWLRMMRTPSLSKNEDPNLVHAAMAL